MKKTERMKNKNCFRYCYYTNDIEQHDINNIEHVTRLTILNNVIQYQYRKHVTVVTIFIKHASPMILNNMN